MVVLVGEDPTSAKTNAIIIKTILVTVKAAMTGSIES
jgi:hypothetical protein